MPVSGSGEILVPLTRYRGVSQVCAPPEKRFDMSNAPPGGRGVWQPSQAMTALTREPPRSTGVSARAALSIAQSAVTMIVTTRWIFGLVRPRKLWIAAAPTLPAMIDNTSVCRAFIITPLPVVARTPRILARTFEIMLRPRETRNHKRLRCAAIVSRYGHCAPSRPGIIELRMADGESLAISVPAGETRVLKHFQARMPYGLSVPDVP